jgi:hypothetical protein
MTTFSLVVALLLVPSISAAADDNVTVIVDASGVVARALEIIGHARQRVILFDPQQYDEAHRRKLETLEAFVLDGHQEIYLNARGKAYREAASHAAHGVYILAAIMAHEIAHLSGQNERGALAEERRWVYAFMKEGKIKSAIALAHFESAWEARR